MRYTPNKHDTYEPSSFAAGEFNADRHHAACLPRPLIFFVCFEWCLVDISMLPPHYPA